MTIIVNLFGGPGSGKSTAAAKIFAALKDLGVNVELVTEFAKDLTWEGAHNTLMFCQPFVTGTQIWRVEKLVQAGVQVVVTDSPPLLGSIYGSKDWPGLGELLGHYHHKHSTLNFQLTRVKPFSQHGRNQNEEEARSLDQQIGWLLDHWGVNPWIIPGDSNGANQAVNKIMEYV